MDERNFLEYCDEEGLDPDEEQRHEYGDYLGDLDREES